MKHTMKSVFGTDIERFIAHKNALGYAYKSGTEAMRNFDAFCAKKGVCQSILTCEIVEEWCIKRPAEHYKTHIRRRAAIRHFALFLENEGHQTYVIPFISAGAYNGENFTPYIFTKAELISIFHAVDKRPKRLNTTVSMTEVMPMLLRLMYGCGLRVSEATKLKKHHVDLENGILTILESKDDKDRLVPMSPVIAAQMRVYMGKMEYICPNMAYAFPNRTGGKLSNVTIYARFRTALFDAGIPHGGRGNGPRLHDLRHTFAVHSLEKMATDGMDLYCVLPILSTYLGHSDVTSTEKYLRLTQEAHSAVLQQISETYGEIAPTIEKGAD